MPNGHAQVDTLIVDPSACSGGPPVYCDLQAALDGAVEVPVVDVLVLLTAGTYDAAPVGGFAIKPGDVTAWTVVVKPYPGHEDQVTIVRHGGDIEPVPASENEAAIEIHNDGSEGGYTACYDMRVTIQGLNIETIGPASGISVWSSVSDPTRLYNTGLFIQGNTITNDALERVEAPPQGPPTVTIMRGKGLVIGKRPQDNFYTEHLANQSIKWGEITDNEIDASADGATCWAFAGIIANNRVHSEDNEGWHHSLGRIVNTGSHPAPPFLLAPGMEQYRELLVEHNLFYCNWQLGFHFAHGSEGIIRNNIFTKSRDVDLGSQRGGIGLSFGGAQENPELACYEWGSTITDENLGIELGYAGLFTEANRIVNNTFDASAGPGVLTEGGSVRVRVFKGNLLTRNNLDLQFAEKAIDRNAGGPPDIFGDPDALENDPKGWNVYWGNSSGNYGDPIFVGVNDKTAGSNPYYVGDLEGPEKYSYMLRTVNAGPPCAHVVQGQQSGAIDAGPPVDVIYFDAENGPGLGGIRTDAGAFGGEFNWWDPTGGLACLQYDTGVVNCGN